MIVLFAWCRSVAIKNFNATTETRGRSHPEEILIIADWSSLNFNSLVRAEWSFLIRYPNVVIKSLCGFSGKILFVWFRFQSLEMPSKIFRSQFWAKIATENRFSCRKTDHMNGVIVKWFPPLSTAWDFHYFYRGDLNPIYYSSIASRVVRILTSNLRR